MNSTEAREQGYSPTPVKPLITVGKSFSLAWVLSLFKKKREVIASEDLAPEIQEKPPIS
jgi:hypothetical protein